MTPNSLRRFTSVHRPRPTEVRGLGGDHYAMAGDTTMFRGTVVTAADSPRLLVSGHNNRKIGKRVLKGPWAGMPIYTLTLTERATCPDYCHLRSVCYGNAMHLARRHQVGPKFEARLEREVASLADEQPQGFVVRLHVLGDFYSVGYVELWRRMLGRHRALHVYGYTGRDLRNDRIGTAIGALDADFPDRCFIRFSSAEGGFMGATVIDYMPSTARVEQGIVCPAETQAAQCCATCGLCWAEALGPDDRVCAAWPGADGQAQGSWSMSISKLLAARLREYPDWSDEQIAEAVGCSAAFVRAWKAQQIQVRAALKRAQRRRKILDALHDAKEGASA